MTNRQQPSLSIQSSNESLSRKTILVKMVPGGNSSGSLIVERTGGKDRNNYEYVVADKQPYRVNLRETVTTENMHASG